MGKETQSKTSILTMANVKIRSIAAKRNFFVLSLAS